MLDEILGENISLYQQARKDIERNRARRVFFVHFIAYIAGNLFLGGWNALTYFVKDSPTLWFFLPLLFWGVGVVIHYLHSVALFGEWWEQDERQITERL